MRYVIHRMDTGEKTSVFFWLLVVHFFFGICSVVQWKHSLGVEGLMIIIRSDLV